MLSRAFRSAGIVVRTGALALVLAGAGMAQAAAPMADEAIVEQLTQAGMTDVVVTHAGDKINVVGTLDGKGAELVYDAATGNLVTFNGDSPSVDAHVAFMNLGKAPEVSPKD
ncbi:hypothetical protein [Paracoccus sp. (in: a-proteobacteria)]|uniref:hypothetical protein n=1 Tax=Paracoccus sp. TaxID=267 RepID=UPI00321FEBF4